MKLFRYRSQKEFELWIQQCKKFAYQKCVVAKSWDDLNSFEVTKFCTQVQFKSFFSRIFRKSPKFNVASKQLFTATRKDDAKVPVAEDKVPLLDPLMDSVSGLVDEVGLLTGEVQAVKTTLKKAKDKKVTMKEAVG